MQKYNPVRYWLEPWVVEKGKAVHFAGISPHRWNPDMCRAMLYNQRRITMTVEKINNLKVQFQLKRLPNLNKARDEVMKLAMGAPNDQKVLQFCAAFSKEDNDVIAREGYLRCMLQHGPLESSLISERLLILEEVDKHDDAIFAQIDTLNESYINTRPATHQLTADKKNAYDEEMNKRAFVERLIYNTVAIEGNTMGPDEVRTVIGAPETRLQYHSEAEHQEVIGMVHVIDYIEKKKNSGLFTIAKFKLEDLLEIHERVMLDKPNVAGKLRPYDICVSNVPFVPVEHSKVGDEMDKLLEFMKIKPVRMSGVEFAALLHYAFVYIHPFADGNGRVARLLLNMALEEYGYSHIIVPVLERSAYMNSIYFGHMGDLRKFIRYIAQLLEKRLEEYIHRGPYSQVDSDESPHTRRCDDKSNSPMKTN